VIQSFGLLYEPTVFAEIPELIKLQLRHDLVQGINLQQKMQV